MSEIMTLHEVKKSSFYLKSSDGIRGLIDRALIEGLTYRIAYKLECSILFGYNTSGSEVFRITRKRNIEEIIDVKPDDVDDTDDPIYEDQCSDEETEETEETEEIADIKEGI